MTRETIDHHLRSMRWGARLANNAETVGKLEELRSILPSTPLPAEWATFIDRLIVMFFNAPWDDVDLQKFQCAFALEQACKDAGGDPSRFPEDVLSLYRQTTKRGDSFSNRKLMAGAFAVAKGFHRGPSTASGINAAGEWMVGKRAKDGKPEVVGALTYGERMGMTFRGLGSGR